jgi:hypothetical protein
MSCPTPLAGGRYRLSQISNCVEVLQVLLRRRLVLMPLGSSWMPLQSMLFLLPCRIHEVRIFEFFF